MYFKCLAVAALLSQVARVGSLPLLPRERLGSRTTGVVFTYGDHATEVNSGDTIQIGYMKNEQICCRPVISEMYDLSDCQVFWKDENGNKVESWSQGRDVFTLGGSVTPHSYLVFLAFGRDLAGPKTCVLQCKGLTLVEDQINIDELT